MQTWMIGNTTVTRIEEQVGPNDMPAGVFLPDLVRERLRRICPGWCRSHYDPADDKLITSNHSWLIRTDAHTILLDSCAGNHKERPWLPRFHHLNVPFLERLAPPGPRRTTSTSCCARTCTPIMSAGTRGCENGRWVPTFPSARYLFSRIEHEHWIPRSAIAAPSTPAGPRCMTTACCRSSRAGQAVLLDGEHAIDDQLFVAAGAGAHAGACGAEAGRRRAAGAILRRRLHHPVQVHEPDWNTRFCEIPEQARATRAQVAGALRRTWCAAVSHPLRRAACRTHRRRRKRLCRAFRAAGVIQCEPSGRAAVARWCAR